MRLTQVRNGKTQRPMNLQIDRARSQPIPLKVKLSRGDVAIILPGKNMIYFSGLNLDLIQSSLP